MSSKEAKVQTKKIIWDQFSNAKFALTPEAH